MIRQLIKKRRKRILVDISTQKDFFLAGGSSCIRNHRRVLANLRRIMAWARHNNIHIISTCDLYPNNNGGSAIKYCLDGTDGQKKIRYTLSSNRINLPADGSTDLPEDLLRKYSQIILSKRSEDPFDEPRIDRLFSEVQAGEFILVGASAEGSVKATALGLLQRAKKVTIVTDAIGSMNRKEAELALRKMQSKGASLIETKKLAGTSHLRSIGICDCDLCRGYANKLYLHTN